MSKLETEVVAGVRGLFVDADTTPDVVMVGGVHFTPTNAVRMSAQESERATALARDLVIKYRPPRDESGSGREECLEVAAGRMMKKLLREVSIGGEVDESYPEPTCTFCARGEIPHVLDEDGLLSSESGKPGALAHYHRDGWRPCNGAPEQAEVEGHEVPIGDLLRIMKETTPEDWPSPRGYGYGNDDKYKKWHLWVVCEFITRLGFMASPEFKGDE